MNLFCFVFQSNGLKGLMRKYAGCMVAGAALSLIGIRGDYHHKLARFYTSQQYENVNRLLRSRWSERKNGESESATKFVKVNTMDIRSLRSLGEKER